MMGTPVCVCVGGGRVWIAARSPIGPTRLGLDQIASGFGFPRSGLGRMSCPLLLLLVVVVVVVVEQVIQEDD